MKLEVEYEKEGKLNVCLINDSIIKFVSPMIVTINGEYVKYFYRISVKTGERFSFTIDIKLHGIDNYIEVKCGEITLTEKINIPEHKLACKLIGDFVVVYNPYDNPEVKNLVVRVYFWCSEFQDFIIESIKPGTGEELIHKFKRNVSEVTINGERVLKTY